MADDVELDGWSEYFDGMIQFLQDTDRHYGISNIQYTQYVLERMELCISSCRSLKDVLMADSSLQSYIDSLHKLLECLLIVW